MKKTYCLFLDESGDFSSDLKSSWKNECLVGGYLLEKEKIFEHTIPRKILADAYRTLYSEQKQLNDMEASKKIRHATELQKEKKAQLFAQVLPKL